MYTNEDIDNMLLVVKGNLTFKKILDDSIYSFGDKEAIKDCIKEGYYERFERYDSAVCEEFITLYEDFESVRKRIEILREELSKASSDYYNGTESMSNYEYDSKFDELAALEDEYGDENNFTSKVGAKVDKSSALKEITHEYQAKSLGKSKSVDELIKEQSKTSDKEAGFTCLSWKLDGMTVQLTYDGGKLILAATRGDGEVGQDITEKTKYVEGVPQNISYKGKVVVRGEAFMTYEDFEKANENGQFANPRNLASATLTALDNNLLKDRHITFNAFELVDIDEPSLNKAFSQSLDFLKEQGFGVVEHEVVQISNLKEKIKEWSDPNRIKDLGIPVDGLVVAYNDKEKTKDLVGTGHNPSKTKSMAFKWADDTVKTVLRDIEWSPSRTGLINPVAVFDTVNLCGTKVSRASIHNVSYMENLNLKIGDEITVYKANMIIPQIAENLNRGSLIKPVSEVDCPCCKNKAVIKENNGTKVMFCENEKCLAKELGTFVRFSDKHGMNIEGLSEKKLLLLMEKGFLTELSDLYRLKDHPEIAKIEGFGDKSYQNLIDSVEKSKNTDIKHFLYACGIEGIGKGQLDEIVSYLKEHYDTDLSGYHYEDGSYDLIGTLVLMQEDNFDFTKIDGIGDVLAKNFSDFIQKELVEPYESCISGKFADCLPFTTFRDKVVSQNKDAVLSGKTFVITGSLNNFANRDEMVAYIESLGGKVSGSVSKNTDYLINNDIESTSGKNKKAKDLNIPIISEETFLSSFGNEKEDIEIER